MRVPYHFWRRLVLPALILSCGMMLLPFIPGIGDRVNDANAWIAIGPLSLQPSEFLKLSVLLYCANLLAKRRDEMADPSRTLIPVMIVAVIGSGLCLVQSDLGSAIVLASIVFVVAFIAGAPLRPMGGRGDGRCDRRACLRRVEPAPRKPASPRSSTSPRTRTTSAIRRTKR